MMFQLKNKKVKITTILPIKFNFTIHGVSGIKVGDTFNITDLPVFIKRKYFKLHKYHII